MSFVHIYVFAQSIYFQFLVFLPKFSTHFKSNSYLFFAGFQLQMKLAEEIRCRSVWEIGRHKTGDT